MVEMRLFLIFASCMVATATDSNYSLKSSIGFGRNPLILSTSMQRQGNDSADNVFHEALNSVAEFKEKKRAAKLKLEKEQSALLLTSNEDVSGTSSSKNADRVLNKKEITDDNQLTPGGMFSDGLKSAEPWIHMLLHVSAFAIYSICAIVFAVASGSYTEYGSHSFKMVSLLFSVTTLYHAAATVIVVLPAESQNFVYSEAIAASIIYLEACITLPLFVHCLTILAQPSIKTYYTAMILGVCVGAGGYLSTAHDFWWTPRFPFLLTIGISMMIACFFLRVINSAEFKCGSVNPVMAPSASSCPDGSCILDHSTDVLIDSDGTVLVRLLPPEDSERLEIALSLFNAAFICHILVWLFAHVPPVDFLRPLPEDFLQVVITIVGRLMSCIVLVTSAKVRKDKRGGIQHQNLTPAAILGGALRDRGLPSNNNYGLTTPLLQQQ